MDSAKLYIPEPITQEQLEAKLVELGCQPYARSGHETTLYAPDNMGKNEYVPLPLIRQDPDGKHFVWIKSWNWSQLPGWIMVVFNRIFPDCEFELYNTYKLENKGITGKVTEVN